MASDLNSKVLENLSRLVNPYIQPTTNDTNEKWRDIAATVGNALSEAEDAALLAFSYNDNTPKGDIIATAKKLGLSDAKAATVTAEGLQLVAQRVVDKARRVYEYLSNFFKAKDNTEQQINANMRV